MQPSGAITATMTFVVYFDDDAISGWVRERARLVSDKHPSRVIVFDGTKRPSSGGEGSGPQEWVELGARDSDANALSSALSAYALAEAPIVLAWIASTVKTDVRFSVLAARAQTVICSSSVTDIGAESVRELIRFVESHPEIDVQDLAYVRLLPWQSVVAELFDDPHWLQDLFRIRHVDITAGSYAEAYYLLAWLASRLQWSNCAKGRMCNRAGEIVTFTITRDGMPRRVERIRIATDGTTYEVHAMADDPDVACVTVSGHQGRESRFVPLIGLDIASLVARAVLTHNDPVFRQTLKMAKTIIDSQG